MGFNDSNNNHHYNAGHSGDSELNMIEPDIKIGPYAIMAY